jgi:hypothetical protein
MRVNELRRRLLQRMWEVAANEDAGATARVTSYARASLISLAGLPADREVDLQELTVGTRIAAWILGMHPEYVRYLIRSKSLRAEKANGEFSIPLQEVVRFMGTGTREELREGAGVRIFGLYGSSVVRPWPPNPAPSEEESPSTTIK